MGERIWKYAPFGEDQGEVTPPILSSQIPHCPQFSILRFRKTIWKFFYKYYSFQFMKFRCRRFVLFPASFWSAYHRRNLVWPMGLERANPCDSCTQSFLKKRLLLLQEKWERPCDALECTRMTTHNSACALKGLKIASIAFCANLKISVWRAFKERTTSEEAGWIRSSSRHLRQILSLKIEKRLTKFHSSVWTSCRACPRLRRFFLRHWTHSRFLIWPLSRLLRDCRLRKSSMRIHSAPECPSKLLEKLFEDWFKDVLFIFY